MSHDTDDLVDPCPPVTLPPDSTFPVRIDVPIPGLLLRNEEDLERLNQLLKEIRRIPLRVQTAPDTDPDAQAQWETFFWLEQQRELGSFEDFQGQCVVGTEKRIIGIGADSGEVIRRAMEADPTLQLERIAVIRVPSPEQPFILPR